MESDYGYHILLRKELTEDQIMSLAGDHLTDLLNDRMTTALEEMTRSEKLEGIDAGQLYTRYIEITEQVQLANASEDGGTAE